jgi:hypothetical protein
MKTKKHYTLAGFEPGTVCSGGGCDDQPPGADIKLFGWKKSDSTKFWGRLLTTRVGPQEWSFPLCRSEVGWTLTPRGIFNPFIHPQGWALYIYKNEWNRGSSPLGDKFTPRGQSSRVGANFTPGGKILPLHRGEIKNCPLFPVVQTKRPYDQFVDSAYMLPKKLFGDFWGLSFFIKRWTG